MPKSPVTAKRTPLQPNAQTPDSSPAGLNIAVTQIQNVGNRSSYEEAQNDEIEALQSIYMEDYQTVEIKTAWSKPTERSFRLRLSSYSDHEVAIVLLATLTATYPKTLPLLRVDNISNVRQDTLKRVQQLILNKPKELTGEVMIHALAAEIQDILEDDVSARARDQNLPSLEEERAAREAEANRLAKQQEEALAKLTQEAEAEESRKMQRMLDEEIKRREEVRQKRRSEPGVSQDEQSERVIFDHAVASRDEQGNELLFRSVLLAGELAAESAPQAVTAVYRAIPVNAQPSSPCLVMKRAKMNCSTKQSVLDLERLLEKLTMMRHANIINVLAFKIENVNESWQFDILTELGSQGSLSDMLHIVDTLPAHKVRAFSVELLEALNFYHTKGIVHGRLHAGNVLICRLRSGIITVKLADAGFQNALHGQMLGHSNSTIKHESRPLGWRAPELALRGNNDKSQKVDVWDFGAVLVEMLFGFAITQDYAAPISFIRNAGLSRPFADLVRDTFRSDSRKRPSAFEILPYEFLRTDVPATELTATNSKPRTASHGAAYAPASLKSGLSIDAALTMSRYANEWVEAGRLGKGGYGEVVKARNKVDGRIYAIKKITQKSPSELSQVLSEVHLLATLNHPYVVRYYTAWPEDDTIEAEAPSEDMSSSLGDGFFAKGNSTPSFDLRQSTGGLDFISSSGFPKIEFGEASESSEAEDESEDEHSPIRIKPAVASNISRQPCVKFGTESSGTESCPEDVEIHADDQALPPAPNNVRSRFRGQTKSDSETSGIDNGLLDGTRVARSLAQPMTATLYIQMEFCERLTLRDMIRKGINENIDDVWRFFRQVLEGLMHIHSHGIIHRDLKPENVFVDAANNPRIGDFGLATSGQFQLDRNVSTTAPENGNLQPDSRTMNDGQVFDGDMTRNIGTTFYVAPELRTRGQYTEKIDMYSLGIMLFEMCFPLRTGMERGQVLTALREKEHTLPAVFQNSDMAVLGEIILSLLNHKPSERPSSVELLRSGKVPVQIEDETIRIALESLADDSSPYYHRVMSALFSKGSNPEIKAQMWDMRKARALQTPVSNYELVRAMVKERLVACFRRHGAIETQRQGLMPRSDFYTNNNIVQLLDASGTLVQLPFDLTLPHARSVARQSQAAGKSFTFGTVYRDALIGGAPRSNGEADFDIVSYDSKDLALQDAEVIKVMDEVLHEIPSVASAQMCFHLSHSSLLEIIMEFCRIEISSRPAVKEILGRLNIQQWTWQKIRLELRSASVAVPSTSLDDLAQFDFRDTPEACFSRLQTIFSGTKFLPQIHDIFTHVSGLVEYCKRYGVSHKIYFSPLSSFNDKFYQRGIMFQCLFDTRKREVLAAGGRYDRLVEAHLPRTSEASTSSPLHAVGLNIAWDTLVSSMIRFQKHASTTFLKKSEDPDPPGTWMTRRCDILIASFDPAVLRSTGVRLLSTLWAADISAELATDADSPEALLARHRDDRHSWLLTIKHDAGASSGGKPDLRLKSLDKKEDFDVRTSELLPLLRAELRDRDVRESSTTATAAPGRNGPRLSRLPSHPEAPLATAQERKTNVQVLLASHKSKKANKWRLVEGAQAAVQELTRGMAEGPVACVETRDEVLEQIRETRLSDPESWRRVIREVALSERGYVQQVYDLMGEFREQVLGQGGEAGRGCFVYNFRTGACVHYDLLL